MIKFLAFGLFWALFTLPASAAFDVGQLMASLARHPGGTAKFVETRFLAVLDKPLRSSGELTYNPPDRLEKRTLTPKPETLILDKNTLTLQREKQTLSINLASQPQAMAFVDSIRSTLAGNRASLERNYLLHLAGNETQWVLTLLPRDEALAAFVQRIVVSGSRDQMRSIEYLQADGDRSLLTIDPIRQP